jgi:hypothetical protein
MVLSESAMESLGPGVGRETPRRTFHDNWLRVLYMVTLPPSLIFDK